MYTISHMLFIHEWNVFFCWDLTNIWTVNEIKSKNPNKNLSFCYVLNDH